MSNRSLFALAVLIPLFVGCDSFGSISLGRDEGIPAVKGSKTITIPLDYKCGDPITDSTDKYTVVSSGTQEACTFKFSQDVTVITAADYDSRPELKGATFIEAVEFDVNKLAVNDAVTMKPLDPTTQLKDLTGTAFGTKILSKDDLSAATPFQKRVEGEPIDALKSQVEARKDIIVPVVVDVLVALTPMPPGQIALEFDAQPNIIVGF